MATETLTAEDLQLRSWIVEQGEQRGNAVISVSPDGEDAGYCFTACAWALHGVPEAVVIGLPEEMSVVLLDAYVDRAATGERFHYGVLYHDFFDGAPVVFEKVAKGYYPEFFGSAFLIYPDGDFPAVQIIVPTDEGAWPWDADAPAGFAEWQRVLTESGQPESWNPDVVAG